MNPFYILQGESPAPYSVAQFRADHPTLSISDDPHDGQQAKLPAGFIYKDARPTL